MIRNIIDDLNLCFLKQPLLERELMVAILESLKVEEDKISKDARIGDPYIDRRSGEDRRQVYDADYFQNDGLERRSGKERRRDYGRRKDYIRVSEWSSICPVDKD